MRRFATIPIAAALVGLFASGASAKGFEQNAKVTISGAGLPGGIVTLEGDGGRFVLGSSVHDLKWDPPNIGGSLRPGVDLGPAFRVRVVLRCVEGGHARYDQTLYPNAPQGPQLFTGDGVVVCGDAVPGGYVPLGPETERLLRSHGVDVRPLEAPAPVTDTASSRSGGGTSFPALAVIGLPFVLAALVVGEVLRRRRRASPA
jgi:hypothetical protein